MLFDKKLLISFKNNAAKLGLRPTIGKLFDDFKIKNIYVFGKVPEKGPILIISNHPGILDTLLLCSQVNREDLHFIALAEYGILGRGIRKFLLPIYRKKKSIYIFYKLAASVLKNAGSPEATDGSASIFLKEKLSRPEILAKNRSTISKAAKLINQSHAVSIFPAGSVGKPIDGHEWKPGLGFLIKQISNPNAQVVFANLQGTKKIEALSLFNPLIRKIFFRPTRFSIAFSKSYRLNQLVDRDASAKTITKILEQKYKEFAERSYLIEKE